MHPIKLEMKLIMGININITNYTNTDSTQYFEVDSDF
jgi:hypothetical protein